MFDAFSPHIVSSFSRCSYWSLCPIQTLSMLFIILYSSSRTNYFSAKKYAFRTIMVSETLQFSLPLNKEFFIFPYLPYFFKSFSDCFWGVVRVLPISSGQSALMLLKFSFFSVTTSFFSILVFLLLDIF